MADDDFTYQGKPIDEFKLAFTGLRKMPCADANGDKPLHLDDIVSLHFEGRVIGHRHDFDKEGRLIVTAVVSPMDVSFQPWDTADPNDDGVSRANRVLGP